MIATAKGFACGAISLAWCLWMPVPLESAPAGGFDPFAGDEASATSSSQPAPSELPAVNAIGTPESVAGLGPTIARVQFHDDDLSLVFQVISDATGWSIFPGAKVGGKVTLYARDITAGDLLEAAVKMAGFVHVRQGRIITVMTYEDYMLHHGVVKRTFPLQYRDAAQLAGVLTPFVSIRGKLVADAAVRALIVYEIPANLPLLEDIIGKLDQPADSKVVRVIRLVHAEAERLAEYLSSLFADEAKPAAGEAAVRLPAPSSTQPAVAAGADVLSAEQRVQIHAVPRTNHLILRGYAADLARLEELVGQLDAPEDLQTRHYPVTHLSAREVCASLQEALGAYGPTGPGSDRNDRPRGRDSRGLMNGPASERIRISYLEESNAIVATAPALVHERVAEFLRLCDTPPLQVAGGIRHYRLENASADQVSRILLDLINQGQQQAEEGEFKLGSPGSGPAIIGPSVQGPSAQGPAVRGPASPGSMAGPAPRPMESGGVDDLIGVAADRRTEKPRITFSETTNTVIIQATVQEHVQFAQIIRELDRQLAQVLLEAVLVEIRGSDEIDVGVELENFGPPGDCVGRLLFTSFGFSTVNPATGQRVLSVGPGGTAAITRQEDVPAILHALQASGKARIRSAPRLLVNDNSPGVIQSIAEEPYSQVNASTTVATTSFGGFVQAGTQLRITPHVSNDDYLRLEYEITLNSFRGASGNPDLPPARDTSTINSQATVPDAGTLIVAGLSHQAAREVSTRLPVVGDLPVLDLVFGRQTAKEENIRLYVFLRPTILRDSEFRQLRQISEHERQQAGEPSGYPSNSILDPEWEEE